MKPTMRLCLVAAALFCWAAAVSARSLAQRQVPVPCVMKYYNGFCYLERKADVCTFYSSPSYATYKDCATSTNMGKTLKCAEVTNDQKSAGSFADCLDAEPTAAQKAGTQAKPAAAPAAAPATPAAKPATMPVPCVMKYYDGFCYLERKADVCTFYSSPAYATYKACATSTNMGKTLKCAEVPKDKQSGGSYADCLDAEPTAAQKAGTQAKPAAAALKWASKPNMDVKGLDIACNGKSFCEVCGKSLADVQKQCAATANCKSFTWDNKCAYLKTASGATGMVSRPNWTVYVIGA